MKKSTNVTNVSREKKWRQDAFSQQLNKSYNENLQQNTEMMELYLPSLATSFTCKFIRPAM